MRGGLQGGSNGLEKTGSPGAQTTPSDDSGNASDAEGNSPESLSSDSSGPTFGGGPILGVASTSKAKTIRVFYNKDHYNDWLFIYVPGSERGSQLIGPVSPGLLTSENLGVVAPGQAGGLPGPGIAPSANQLQTVRTQSPQNPGQTPPEE